MQRTCKLVCNTGIVMNRIRNKNQQQKTSYEWIRKKRRSFNGSSGGKHLISANEDYMTDRQTDTRT